MDFDGRSITQHTCLRLRRRTSIPNNDHVAITTLPRLSSMRDDEIVVIGVGKEHKQGAPQVGNTGLRGEEQGITRPYSE